MTPKERLAATDPVFARIRAEEKQRIPKFPLLNELIFCIVLLAAELIEIPLKKLAVILFPHLTPTQEMAVWLYMTAVPVICAMLYVHFGERRSLRSTGLCARHCVTDYLLGGIAGLGMFGLALWLSCMGGAAVFVDAPHRFSVPVLTGWLVQGFSEEYCFRGYLMTTLGTHKTPAGALQDSAVMFAFAHLFNAGFSPLAAVNLLLFGWLMGLLLLRTDSIWLPAAMHSIWNWAQGNFFGMRVSGLETGDSVFCFALTGEKKWLGGGTFGTEGGAAATLVLLAALAAVYFIPQRKADTIRRGAFTKKAPSPRELSR